jgi:hypothetical protein
MTVFISNSPPDIKWTVIHTNLLERVPFSGCFMMDLLTILKTAGEYHPVMEAFSTLLISYS